MQACSQAYMLWQILDIEILPSAAGRARRFHSCGYLAATWF